MKEGSLPVPAHLASKIIRQLRMKIISEFYVVFEDLFLPVCCSDGSLSVALSEYRGTVCGVRSRDELLQDFSCLCDLF